MLDTSTETANRPTLIRAEPQLFVCNLAASIDFFTGKLGFGTAFLHGDPPFYAQVVRGGAHLNLRHVDRSLFDEAAKSREKDVLSATIAVDDAKPLFLEFQEKGVAFHQALRTEPWGAQTFIVTDPDGNLIAFSGRG